MEDDQKVAAIKEVQAAVEAAMAAVVTYLTSANEPTAEAAHACIDTVLAAHDCESPEGHIVSCGSASAEPHEAGSGPIERGVPIVIDIYPRSRTTGYFADMTRTICLGAPSAAVERMYNTVLEAQQLAIDLVKPGVLCRTIQEAVEAHFAAAGYATSGQGKEFRFAEGFVHGVGHGVGKAIHEVPHLTRGSNDVLRVGDVITIEPGLYYSDHGGVRIEDLLLVTEDGAVNLSQFSRQFRYV